jgi:hypothetical protein
MQVDIRVWPCQHAVLVPAGVPGHQPVALELQVGNVRGLLGRVGDNKEDVEDRLRREPRDRCRSPRVLAGAPGFRAPSGYVPPPAHTASATPGRSSRAGPDR